MISTAVSLDFLRTGLWQTALLEGRRMICLCSDLRSNHGWNMKILSVYLFSLTFSFHSLTYLHLSGSLRVMSLITAITSLTFPIEYCRIWVSEWTWWALSLQSRSTVGQWGWQLRENIIWAWVSVTTPLRQLKDCREINLREPSTRLQDKALREVTSYFMGQNSSITDNALRIEEGQVHTRESDS